MELSRYLDLPKETVWPIDCGPGTDIPRRDGVGRPSVPARLATKPVPRRPILLRNMATLGTSLARVRRIDGNHGNSSQQRLVFDELALLMERPAMQSCSLSATGRYPVTDALEVFQGDAAPGALRLVHECLADLVVDVSPETSLSTGNLSEFSLGSLGALLLEVSVTVGVSPSYLFNGVSRVGAAIGVCGEVHDPEIDTQEVSRVCLGTLSHLARDGEKPLAHLCTDEIDFSDTRFEHLTLPLAAFERHLDAAVERPDGDVGFAPRQNSRIVGLCPMATELAGLGSSSHGMGGGNLGDAPHGRLSPEPEEGTYFAVDGLLDGDLVEDSERDGLLGDPGARLVAPLQSRLEEGLLLLRREEANLHDEVHGVSLRQDETGCKPVSKGAARRLRLARPLGLRDQVPGRLHHGARGDRAGGEFHEGMWGFQCGFGGGWVGRGSRTSADIISTQGGVVRPGQFAQGGKQSEAAGAGIQGSQRRFVGEGVLVTELLRGVLWGRSARKDQEVC